MGVINIQRIANPNGVLVGAERAIKLGPGLKVTDYPDGVLAGTVGALGEVTGYSYIEIDTASPPAGLARPLIHRFLFAAGTAYTAAAQALAANAALAAETTLVSVTGLTTASATWTPPAGAKIAAVIRHALADFTTGAANSPTWELTTAGATLFPGYDYDIGTGIVGDSFPNGTAPNAVGVVDLSDITIGGGTVTVTFAASPAVAITSGAGAVVVRASIT